jgi:signal transduction histidine kinase
LDHIERATSYVPRPRTSRERLLVWLAIGGIFIVLAVLYTVEMSVVIGARGRQVEWEKILTSAGFRFYFWAFFGPLVFFFAQQYPIQRSNWLRRVALHAGMSILLLFADAAITFAIGRYFFGFPIPSRSDFIATFWGNIYTHSWYYWPLVGLGHAFFYYGAYREREMQALALERQLAISELQVLKMQLHPHFLFNTLNSISALMTSNVGLAQKTLSRLGELLRLSFQYVAMEETTLREELQFLELYVQIQQTRFGDRMTFKTEIDPATLDACVPSLLLQPLVENAIQHGISALPRGGTIEVSSRRRGSDVYLHIRDNGPGMRRNGDSTGGGVGLANTRARIEQLYGHRGRIHLQNRDGGGFEVTVAIPYKAVGAPEAAEPVKAGELS